MSRSGDVAEQRLAGMPPTFTTVQARRAGISSQAITALRERGLVEELSRGVFRQADAPETAHADLIAVATRAPRAVVCVESALALHELIDDIPIAVQIAVPRGAHRPRITYPPVKVWQFDASTFAAGQEGFEAAPGEFVPVYSAARSVVDAMRLRRLVGETLALGALGRYLRRHGHAGVPDLEEFAMMLGGAAQVRRAVEAVLA